MNDLPARRPGGVARLLLLLASVGGFLGVFAIGFPPASRARLPILCLAIGLALLTAYMRDRGIVVFAFLFPLAGLGDRLAGGADAMAWPVLLFGGLAAGWTFRFLYDFESAPDPSRADRTLRALLVVWSLATALAVVQARTLWALVRGLGLRAVNVEGLSDSSAIRTSVLSYAALAAGAAFFFLLRRAGPALRERALLASLTGVAASAAVAVAERLGIGPGETNGYWKNVGRLSGGAMDPNALGILCGLGAVVAADRAVLGRGRGRSLAAVALAFMAAGLALSGSRSGVAIAGIGIVALLAARGTRRARPRRGPPVRCGPARRRRGPARLQRPGQRRRAPGPDFRRPPAHRVPRVRAADPLGERRATLRAVPGRRRGPRSVFVAAAQPARRAGPSGRDPRQPRQRVPSGARGDGSRRPHPDGGPGVRARPRVVGGAARRGGAGRGRRQRRGGDGFPRRFAGGLALVRPRRRVSLLPARGRHGARAARRASALEPRRGAAGGGLRRRGARRGARHARGRRGLPLSPGDRLSRARVRTGRRVSLDPAALRPARRAGAVAADPSLALHARGSKGGAPGRGGRPDGRLPRARRLASPCRCGSPRAPGARGTSASRCRARSCRGASAFRAIAASSG